MDERRLYRQIDAAEQRLIAKWDTWIRRAFASIPWRDYERLQKLGGPRALEQAPVPMNTYPGALARMLSGHAVEMLMAGQAHAQLLVIDLHRRYRGRKLANYPGFAFDYQEDPRVIPEKAIQAMEARSVYLAGDVDGSLLAGVKKIMNSFLAAASTRQEAETAVEALLASTEDRASLITTTETTYSYNRGRLVGYKENLVDYVQFSAIRDARTSAICNSRHGLMMKMDDPRITDNTPPLHGRCRSVLNPVYSAYQPELITDRNLNWGNTVALPPGWNAK